MPHSSKFCLAFLLLTSAFAVSAEPCAMPADAKEVQVSQVLDGDTVKLADGRSIRAIGIDTPEMNFRKGSPPEHGAERARNRVKQLLGDTMKLRLAFDVEQRDKYGRHLAHWFLPNGRSAQAILLGEGLGTPLIMPPNVQMLECYLHSSDNAIDQREGLWARPEYGVRNIEDLRSQDLGFHRLRARVGKISTSRSSVWLNLLPKGAIRIPKQNLQWFEGIDFDALEGQTIEFRGWVYRSKGRLQILIRHRADLKIKS
ncbi:MAG: thermonuclease family protein [Candidatus Eutrophobiaceae bacterium]